MILHDKGIPERRTEFLETCFDTFCKSGLENTSLQKLAESCGVTNGALLYYFGSKDNLVIEATAHCMAKVEDDFMAQAPPVLRTSNVSCGKCLISPQSSTGQNTALCIRYMQVLSTVNTARRFLKESMFVITNMPFCFLKSWRCRQILLMCDKEVIEV